MVVTDIEKKGPAEDRMFNVGNCGGFCGGFGFCIVLVCCKTEVELLCLRALNKCGGWLTFLLVIP